MTARTGDSVHVHYTGNILYGKVFDNSYFRDEPLAVRIGETNLIDGFTEALQLMSKGQRAVFYIPSGLGYGRSGNVQNVSINGVSQFVQSIPPHAILVFDIELLEIIP